MLPMLNLHRQIDGVLFLLRADAVERLEPNGEGCMVFLTGGPKIQVRDKMEDIASTIAHAIAWKETRVVQGQLDAANAIQKHGGIVTAAAVPGVNGRH